MELDGSRLDAARLVKEARQAARQTQTKLAGRAGVSRGTVAAIESGARKPSWAMLTALLAAAGKQMRIDLEPLDEDVRSAVAAQAGDTSTADDLSMTVSLMEGLSDLAYRFEGLAAAAVLGAPLPLAEPIELVLPDTAEGVDWLAALVRTGAAAVTPAGRSYHLDGVTSAKGVAHLVELGEGGRFLLEIWLCVFTVRFVPASQAGRAVTVVGEHGPLRVQPLHEIETTDRNAARVLRLLREQAQDARD
ncbi:helix-turn-helix transcriptional regulator [Promicromonospora sukumoe]|uniref:helix-turn-helix transcriptional regulator n=1 Tax=Promicromonospora sukumoe TaxID=88382 RepID=UPI000373947C|nr:helix-turn-helix transcriptional regulator [Promicromonospora sukumoe]